MSRVNRGEKLLNRLVSESKITPTGRDWIVAAIDPFHDNQLDNLEGWPDMECGASVVRCVKQSIQIKKPALSAAGNWDCHVVAWPMLDEYTANYYKATRVQNLVNGPAYPIVVPVSSPIGGVTAYGVTPNTDLDIQCDDPAKTLKIGSVSLAQEFTRGAGRLIGMGFEVHNTTADLTKQGSVAVYRQQADSRDPTTIHYYGTTYASSLPVTLVRYPPKSLAEAMLVSGSRQWEARDGCYCVCAFSSEENPAQPSSPTVPLIQNVDEDDAENILNTSAVWVPVPKNVLGGGAAVLPQRVHPIHLSGAIFTGLSDTSTLTLNVNYFYESFPAQRDKAIMVLAKPSCKYDPCVMELYSRLVQELPVGVPVAENGLGDWFLDAATKAAKYIGPLLAAAPHPIAKGAGAALTYLGETGGDYIKRNQQTQPPNAWKRENASESEAGQVQQLKKEVKKIKKKQKKTAKKASNQTQKK